MKGKTAAWALFLLCLLLLSLAATPFSQAADHALVAARFTIVIVVSVLVVHERWTRRHQARGHERPSQTDAAESLLRRCRRWYYGD